VKSDSICDLMAFLFSYMISRGKFLFPTGRHAPLLLGCSICLTEVFRWPLWLGEPQSSAEVSVLSWICCMQASGSAGTAV
jgi:hypothetical protein